MKTLEQVRDEAFRDTELEAQISSSSSYFAFCEGFDAAVAELRRRAPEFRRNQIEDECPNVSDDEWIVKGAQLQYTKDAALIAARDAEIENLRSIIAGKLSENDELRAERDKLLKYVSEVNAVMEMRSRANLLTVEKFVANAVDAKFPKEQK